MKRLFPLLFLLAALSCREETEQQVDHSAKRFPQKNVATFAWATELCDYQSTYDPDQYTEKQLQHTHALWLDNWYLEVSTIADTPDELRQLNIDSLHQEYKRMVAYLNRLTVVSVPYWQALKQQRLKAMQSEYQLKQLAIRAYIQPALLRQTTYEPAGNPYVNALVAGDSATLLTAWQRLHEEMKKRVGVPEQLEREFRDKFESGNRLPFARIELMAYGWWNHVHHPVPYVVNDERMETEFKALFTTHKVTCSEP